MLNYVPKLVERATYSQGRSAPRGRAARAGELQIAAWRAFVRAYGAATRSQERTLEGSGLDLMEYDVLVTLAGGPSEGMRPTDLADRVLLTKSGMTRLLQRLEERGLVSREACPLDRRAHFIAMTAAGRHHLRRAAPGLLRGLAAVLAPLSPGDLNALRSIAERITEATTAHSPE